MSVVVFSCVYNTRKGKHDSVFLFEFGCAETTIRRQVAFGE
jgi:hypothetical protein